MKMLLFECPPELNEKGSAVQAPVIIESLRAEQEIYGRGPAPKRDTGDQKYRPATMVLE